MMSFCGLAGKKEVVKAVELQADLRVGRMVELGGSEGLNGLYNNSLQLGLAIKSQCYC